MGAGPIFEVPETDILHDLSEKAAASGGVLYDMQSFGATLNGLGFPAVSHVLMAPQLTLFRSYFPAMDAERFNQIFNRYAHIRLAEKPMPDVSHADVIDVPKDMFVPVRNIRRLIDGAPQPGVCAQPSDGRRRTRSDGDDGIQRTHRRPSRYKLSSTGAVCCVTSRR